MVTTVKERVSEQLEQLNESELRQVADYVAFLKFKSRLGTLPELDESKLAEFYAEAAEEDRELAEAGIEDYARGLQEEDTR